MISYKLHDLAEEVNVHIRIARDKDKTKQGIHLAMPNYDELEDAIAVAARDGFDTIWVHSVEGF